MKIGIAGTGKMGTAVARRLLEQGHEVRVWNRTADHAREACEAGARWTPTPGELANESEVGISFLFDNAAVERVYLGANGLLTGWVEGCLFIDMNTVSPNAHALVNRTLECFDRASRAGSGGVDGVAYPAYWIAQQRALAKRHSTCRE